MFLGGLKFDENEARIGALQNGLEAFGSSANCQNSGGRRCETCDINLRTCFFNRYSYIVSQSVETYLPNVLAFFFLRRFLMSLEYWDKIARNIESEVFRVFWGFGGLRRRITLTARRTPGFIINQIIKKLSGIIGAEIPLEVNRELFKLTRGEYCRLDRNPEHF